MVLQSGTLEASAKSSEPTSRKTSRTKGLGDIFGYFGVRTVMANASNGRFLLVYTNQQILKIHVECHRIQLVRYVDFFIYHYD